MFATEEQSFARLVYLVSTFHFSYTFLKVRVTSRLWLPTEMSKGTAFSRRRLKYCSATWSLLLARVNCVRCIASICRCLCAQYTPVPVRSSLTEWYSETTCLSPPHPLCTPVLVHALTRSETKLLLKCWPTFHTAWYRIRSDTCGFVTDR